MSTNHDECFPLRVDPTVVRFKPLRKIRMGCGEPLNSDLCDGAVSGNVYHKQEKEIVQTPIQTGIHWQICENPDM